MSCSLFCRPNAGNGFEDISNYRKAGNTHECKKAKAGAYGCDVPDDLCYQWAEDYFRDPDAKEDHKEEEKFVPNPYYGKDFARTTKKKQKEKKKAEAKPKPVQKEKPANDGQLSLLDLGMTKAG